MGIKNQPACFNCTACGVVQTLSKQELSKKEPNFVKLCGFRVKHECTVCHAQYTVVLSPQSVVTGFEDAPHTS